MEWIIITVTAVLYAMGCWLTYADGARNYWWYVPLGVLIGAVVNLFWFLAVKWLDDKQRIFVFNLIWDSVLLLIYYILPLILFGVSIDKKMVLAMTLIISGMVVLKL